MRRSRKFSRGGGVTFRPGWVQLHTSGVVINLSKWVDHGTDSYFWYIHRPEQDLMILINLSPQIHGLLRLSFLLSREKNDGWAGNCFGSVRLSFVTLLSALCAFSQRSNLGFHVARLYYTPRKLCLWAGILFSRCPSIRPSVRASVRP